MLFVAIISAQQVGMYNDAARSNHRIICTGLLAVVPVLQHSWQERAKAQSWRSCADIPVGCCVPFFLADYNSSPLISAALELEQVGLELLGCGRAVQRRLHCQSCMTSRLVRGYPLGSDRALSFEVFTGCIPSWTTAKPVPRS